MRRGLVKEGSLDESCSCVYALLKQYIDEIRLEDHR
jgi:hypothetical protein